MAIERYMYKCDKCGERGIMLGKLEKHTCLCGGVLELVAPILPGGIIPLENPKGKTEQTCAPKDNSTPRATISEPTLKTLKITCPECGDIEYSKIEAGETCCNTFCPKCGKERTFTEVPPDNTTVYSVEMNPLSPDFGAKPVDEKKEREMKYLYRCSRCGMEETQLRKVTEPVRWICRRCMNPMYLVAETLPVNNIGCLPPDPIEKLKLDVLAVRHHRCVMSQELTDAVVEALSHTSPKDSPLEDLKKARWYLDRLIRKMEGGKDGKD